MKGGLPLVVMVVVLAGGCSERQAPPDALHLDSSVDGESFDLKPDRPPLDTQSDQPHEMAPADSVPADSAPSDSAPDDIVPADMQSQIDSPATQQLQVTPDTVSLPVGFSQQFTVAGATGQVTWESSDKTVATVDDTGLATAWAKGSTTITATSNGATGSATLAVIGAVLAGIEVIPPLPAIPPGSEQQFSAIAYWSDGTYEEITGHVTWTSSDPVIAEIDAAGLVTAMMPGTVTITAEVCGIWNSADLTVVSVDPVSISIVPVSQQVVALGNTVAFDCEGMLWTDGSTTDCLGTVTWQANPEGIVSFTNNLAQAIAIGSTTVNVSLGIPYLSSNDVPVEVIPATLQGLSIQPQSSPSIPVGTSVVFFAEGAYSDGSTHDVSHQVSWLVDPIASVKFTNNVARGISEGSVQVSASLSGLTSNLVQVDVTPGVLASIAIEPASAQYFVQGDTATFSATGQWTDGSEQDITSQVSWSAVPAGIVSFVGNVAQCQAVGDVEISASMSGVTSNSVPMKISASGFTCIK